MTTRRSLALVPACLLAAGCAATRPTSLRELLPTDVNSCFVKARQYGNPGLQGSASVYLYLDVDGVVNAAWVHDREKLDSTFFFRCLGNVSTLSKFEAEKSDYLRGFRLDCEGVSCSRAIATPGTALEEAVARESLTFSEWATATDKGWGYYYTRQYAEAQAAFNQALQLDAGDVRAMRGLAQSLAESGGDLKAARALADKALAAQKSAAALESLIRVCLKAQDDECAVKAFVDATKAEDKLTRSFELATLNDAARAANGRLEAAERKRAEEAKRADEEAMARADPMGCYKLQGAPRAVCYVRRCFGEGARAYAADLRKATGADYAAGEATGSEGGLGSVVVTIPLRAPPPKAAKGRKKVAPEDKDAAWSVSLGDTIDMRPYQGNLSAYYIAHDHNACK